MQVELLPLLLTKIKLLQVDTGSMIQRLQSILLLLAGLAFLGTVYFRSALTHDDVSWVLPVVMGLNGLAGIGALVSVFLYGNRKQQLKILSLLQYLVLAALLVTFAGLYLTGTLPDVLSNTGLIALIGLPFVGYILIRTAILRIRKDIDLVRSMDRLR